jgi:acetoin utilization deacetylase AcuC-like enzyme
VDAWLISRAPAAGRRIGRSLAPGYRIRIAAPLYLRHEASLGHDTGGHPERAARLVAIEQELSGREWLGYEVREAPEVDDDALAAVHPASHVEAVRAMSERGGWFDADTTAGPGSWEAARHAAGGACELARALIEGEAPTGFAALRPPGHHAEPATAMGFCLFNNIAIAARHALDRLGLERVLILDWDVHHGNGTNDIFHSSREVLYVSIHQSPNYPGTGPLTDSGEGEGEGYTINLPVPPGSGERTWAALVEHVAAPAARAFEPQLILISAGFDAHERDPLASCSLETESYGQMAAQVRALGAGVGAPVGALLEGGYDLEALAASVAATMEALANGAEAPSYEPDEITAGAIEQVERYWRLEPPPVVGA